MSFKCKLEGCNEPLKKGARKFCCEDHSNKHYQNMKKLERLKLKQNNTRFCKYEECGKKLPKDAHAQKEYCPDDKCAYKQNQLDAKRKRAKKRAEKCKELIVCSNTECTETFEFVSRKKYCSKECRNAQNQADFQEKRKTELLDYENAKDEALSKYGTKKEIFIPSQFLGRRFSMKPKPSKRFEIKKMSAKWLQDLWDKRKEKERLVS